MGLTDGGQVRMKYMNTYKAVIMAFAMLPFVLSSCSKDVHDTAESFAISFSASDDVRAPGEMDDIAVDGYGFGVFAFDTGLYRYGDSNVNPNFMYNERVSYVEATSRWTYEPVKYWPNGEGDLAGTTGALASHLSFFAYAPYSDMAEDNPAGYCITTISDQSEPGNPWIVYRIHEDVSQQVDLLYAPTVIDRTLDQTKPDVAARIGFQFRHALACVGEKVRVSCSANLKAALAGEAAVNGEKIQVILQNVRIRYHLTERARLTLWSTGTPRGSGQVHRGLRHEHPPRGAGQADGGLPPCAGPRLAPLQHPCFRRWRCLGIGGRRRGFLYPCRCARRRADRDRNRRIHRTSHRRKRYDRYHGKPGDVLRDEQLPGGLRSGKETEQHRGCTPIEIQAERKKKQWKPPGHTVGTPPARVAVRN